MTTTGLARVPGRSLGGGGRYRGRSRGRIGRDGRPRLGTRRSRALDIDWVLLAAVVALTAIGTMLVWSATYGRTRVNHGDPNAYLFKNLLNVGIGFGLCVAAANAGHRRLRLVTPLVYVASVIGLGLVLSPVGATVNGSRSWIHLPGLSIQPSEFAKVAVIVGMALLIAERTEINRRSAARIGDVVLALVVAAIPVAFVLLQPDLGTVLVMGAIVFGLVAASGVPKRWLLAMVAVCAAVAIAVIRLNVLKDYQIQRFTAFLHPDRDLQGFGYNTHQARIAIGNGGVFGQGLFHGSQTQNQFVPEQHTDFVFTVAGEELGLVGALVIVALFAVVLMRAVSISRNASDTFGRLVAAGIACWFGFQVFENIGMTLGITPVTGLPLPFVSYGGSSMFAGLLAIGLLLNIHRRTQQTHL